MTFLLQPPLIWTWVSSTLAFVFFGYFLSRILKRNDVADFLWGLGFLLIALVQVSFAGEITFRAQVSLVMVTLWAVRLSGYLTVRTFLKTEDIRYKTWRLEWGSREPVMAFLKVFLLQGLVMFVVSSPLVMVIHAKERPLAALDFLAVGLFLIGYVIESVADWEMFRFKSQKTNQGKILTSGLWSISRHPNYFGEILIWWGFGCLALEPPFGLWSLVSPMLITFLLMKVSGVPMLEKRMKSESLEFVNYMKTTPELFPFTFRDILVFASVVGAFIFLDFIWLGLVMNDFYAHQALGLMRLNGTEWDVLLWPAAGVYFFLALAILKFAICESATQSIYRGFILGLCIYGVYDLTNLSTLRNWPDQMSLVDMAWGPFLCALAAAVGFVSTVKLKKKTRV